MNASDTEARSGVSLGDIIANIFVSLLTLFSLAVAVLSGYALTITATSYIKAGGYSNWVETPALLENAANPTEDRPFDAVYDVKGEEFIAPNYGRSFLSLDYEKKRSTRSSGRRRNRGSYARNAYHAGSSVYILVDGDNPRNYQFDLRKDVFLQLGVYIVAFLLSVIMTWKFARILFGKDEKDESVVADAA